MIAAALTTALLSGCVGKIFNIYPTLTVEEFVSQVKALDGVERVRESNGEVLVTLDRGAAKDELRTVSTELNDLYFGHEFEPSAPELRTEYRQFWADYDYVAPSRPAGIPRDAAPDFSVAYELKGVAHITSGEIFGERAELQVDRDLYEWMTTDAGVIGRFITVTGKVTIIREEFEVRYSMRPAGADSQTTFIVLHRILEQQSLGVEELTIDGFKESSLVLTAKKDSVAVAGMKALAEQLYGIMHRQSASTATVPGKSGPHHVSIESAEGLTITASPTAGSVSLGDSADELFATADTLREKGVKVEALRLETGGIDVRVKDSAGVKDVLAAVQKSDSGVPADQDVEIGPVSDEYVSTGMTAAEWSQYSELFGSMLDAGYMGLQVRSFNGDTGHSFDLWDTAAGSPLDPEMRSIIIEQLRAHGWDGSATFMLGAGNHLSFESTACGRAEGARNALSTAPQQIQQPEQDFLDAWNATATC